MIGLLALGTAGPPPAAAGFPPPATLPREQNVILLCTVSDKRTAQDCGPQPGAVPSQRVQAFIQLETESPDYLVGATPGSQVLAMIRRSAAVPLDNANPGRAPAPLRPPRASVVAPDWAIMPSPGDLEGYFPDLALRNGVSGTATVQCTVGVNGDLLGCWVDTENPPDMGFGVSALELATLVRMKPAAKDGSPTIGRTYVLQAAFDVNLAARTAQVTLWNGF